MLRREGVWGFGGRKGGCKDGEPVVKKARVGRLYSLLRRGLSGSDWLAEGVGTAAAVAAAAVSTLALGVRVAMRGKIGRTKWTAPEDDCSPSQKSRSKGAVPGAPKRGEAAPEEVWTTGAGRRDRPEAYGGRGTVAVAAASLQKKASIAHAINTHSE